MNSPTAQLGKWKGVLWQDVPKMYLRCTLKYYLEFRGGIDTRHAPIYKEFIEDAKEELKRKKSLT